MSVDIPDSASEKSQLACDIQELESLEIFTLEVNFYHHYGVPYLTESIE